MRPLIAIALCGLALPALATESAGPSVTIDGRIDPAEWAGARHVTDFRQTMPFSGAPASQTRRGRFLYRRPLQLFHIKHTPPPKKWQESRLNNRDKQGIITSSPPLVRLRVFHALLRCRAGN